jgi:hypothetical protein
LCPLGIALLDPLLAARPVATLGLRPLATRVT